MTYKKGVMIASVISFLIMPWKLMENADSIFIFLNAIGAVLGPVGVMIANYYFVQKQQIDLNALYVDKRKKRKPILLRIKQAGVCRYYSGVGSFLKWSIYSTG